MTATNQNSVSLPHTNPEEATQFYQEAMGLLDRAAKTPKDREELVDIGFAYHHRKINKFARLMALSVLTILKPFFGKKMKSQEIKELLFLIKTERDLQNGATFVNLSPSIQHRGTVHIGSQIISVQTKDNIGPIDRFISNLPTAKERFLFVFMHEAGHFQENLQHMKEKESPTSDRPNLAYPGFSAGLQEFLGEILSISKPLLCTYPSVYSDNSSRLPLSIKKYKTSPIRSNLLALDMDKKTKTQLLELVSHYQSQAKEVYADCFAVAMLSRLEGSAISFGELVEKLACARESIRLGTTDLETIGKLQEEADVGHDTSFGLRYFKQLVESRGIQLEELSLNDLRTLCTEVMVYSTVCTLSEAVLVNANLAQVFHCIEIQKEQLDLFEETIENSSSQFYRFNDLRTILRPEDQNRLREQAQTYLDTLQEIQEKKGQLTETIEGVSVEKINTQLKKLSKVYSPEVAQTIMINVLNRAIATANEPVFQTTSNKTVSLFDNIEENPPPIQNKIEQLRHKATDLLNHIVYVPPTQQRYQKK